VAAKARADEASASLFARPRRPRVSFWSNLAAISSSAERALCWRIRSTHFS